MLKEKTQLLIFSFQEKSNQSKSDSDLDSHDI